jgi:hypothetical protein
VLASLLTVVCSPIGSWTTFSVWPADEPPPELHTYRKSGKLLDHEAFERDVARAIAESHLWQEPAAALAADVRAT